MTVRPDTHAAGAGEPRVRAGRRAGRPSAQRFALAELIARIALETAGEDDPSTILSATLERLAELVPLTGGSIALVEGDALVVRAAIGPFAEQASRQRLQRGRGESWRVVESRRSVRFDDIVATGLRSHAGMGDETIRSWMAAPLVRRGHAIGLLEVDSTEPGVFDDDHLAVLEAVAAALSGPVEIAVRYEGETRALAESEAAQARLAFLADAGEVLTSSMGYEETLASIAELAVPRIADWCAVDLLDQDGPRLVAVAHTDRERVRLGHSLRERRPISLDDPYGTGAVLRTGRPELIRDVSDAMIADATEADPELREILGSLGLRSTICVPMREGHRISGAITLVAAESGRRFGPADLRLAEELASRAGQAVAGARLFREAEEARVAAEQTATRSQQLLHIAAELSTAVTQEDVARAVLERGMAALRAATGSVALISDDGRSLEVVAAAGHRDELLERYRTVPLDSPLPLAAAARTGRIQWLSPLKAAIRRRSRGRDALEQEYRDGRRALGAVPLHAAGRSIGAIGLGFDQPRARTDVDAEYLTALAQHCALAVERARLYEAERAAREGAESAQAALRAREREQATVAALGQRAIGGGSLDDLFRAAVRSLARTLGTEFVELLQLLPGGNQLALVAGIGWGRARGVRTVDAGTDSQAGYTLLTRAPVLVEDLRSEARFRVPRLFSGHGVVGSMTVAVGPGGMPWGVLGAQSSRPRRFTADEVNFLVAVANVLAAAIERQRAEDERDRLLEQERAAQRRREAFIGVMSHELRTPLTTIYAGAKFLARGGRGRTGQARQEVLEDIQAESERLYRLVEDLLVITKAERGMVEAAREPVLLQRILPRVAAAEEKGGRNLVIEVDVPASLPTVRGEETYIEQVVRNLLSNARKYSPPGGLVRLVAAEGPEEVTVRVLDEGPGFPVEEAGQLFELFYRSPGTAGSASGAGIGLFVCRGLVEAMGGRVWAVPRTEGGAEFGFALPRMLEDEAD